MGRLLVEKGASMNIANAEGYIIIADNFGVEVGVLEATEVTTSFHEELLLACR